MITNTIINQDEILEACVMAFSNRDNENATFHELGRLRDLFNELDDCLLETDNQDVDADRVKLALSSYFAGFWNEKIDLTESIKTFLQSHFKGTLSQTEMTEMVDFAMSIQDHSEEKSKEESVLYDVYWSFLGKEKYVRNLELLVLEGYGEEEGKHEAFQNQWEIISSMKFRTKKAIREYSARKSLNTRKLVKAIEKVENKKKKTLRRSQKLGRGIETMYRSIYRNHINLSSIADAKANLIIRVNTIIMSIIITLGGTGYTFFESGFYKYARFTIPVIILLLGSLAAVIFAVLSARPKVTNNEVNRAKIRGNETSILFFGNYIGLDKKEFIREMSLFRQDKKRVYDSMSVDIYFLGIVLDKKYRLVTIAYNLFMLGIALSVLTFIGTFIYTEVYLPNS